MKNPIPIFFLLILFMSACDSNKSEVDILMQVEIMKNEPISNAYFEAISASTKMMAEENIKFGQFIKITRNDGVTPCNVDLELLEGDTVLEEIAGTQCQLIKALKAFNLKYPEVKRMDNEERKKLFAPLIKKAKIDVEKLIETNSNS